MVREYKEDLFKKIHEVISNIILYNATSVWKTENELEEEKRNIERSRYSEEIKNYIKTIMKKQRK